MDTDLLRVFVDVATQGSFAAVARSRAVDPSSVSRAIATLEAELGVRLFQRTTRRMALTDAGHGFLSRVAPLVGELERAREEISSTRRNPMGLVRVTATTALGHTLLVPLLPRFTAEFPRLQLEMVLTDANLDLIRDRIDVAIRLGPSYGANVVGSRLFSIRYRVAASPAYLAREGAPRTPAELSGRDCLLFPIPEFRTRWRFRRGGKIEQVPVSGRLVLSTALALRQAALDGLGPVMLGDWLIGKDLAAGRLVDLFPEHEVTATEFDPAAWLLYPSRDYLPARVRATLDFLRRHVPSLIG